LLQNKNKGFYAMQISVILANPSPDSLNHAIGQVVLAELQQSGHRVVFHDLYAEKFDPILFADEIPREAFIPPEIAEHCREISEADGIVIIHPNWWGQPPAILKGWVDRVIRPGVAYRFVDGDQGEGVPVGLLKAKVACVFNTSNTFSERELSAFGDPLERIWKNCIFDLCGVKTFHRETFSVIVTSTPEQRGEWLEQVRKTVRDYFPSQGPGA
jgi:NAD(P)H dehydrogenase (quinone)